MLLGLFSRRNIKNLADGELLDLVRSHNANALGELFLRYSPLVMGLCLKYLKDVQAAEDVMMELFERLPEKISKSDIQNFKSWLYTVSRNECLMSLRKKKINTGDLEKVEFLVATEGVLELEQKMSSEKELSLLENGILELKTEQKICIELFYLKKKSYEQITKETGFDLKKVKSAIQNGKRNLKILLEEKR